MLVIKRIHVEYRLRLDPGADRNKVERACDLHTSKCPVYRSISGCIDVTTSLAIND